MKQVKTVLKIIKSAEEGGQGLFHKHLNLTSSKCSDVNTDLTMNVLNTHKKDAKGNLFLCLHIPKTPCIAAFTSGSSGFFVALTVDWGHPRESFALIVSKGRVREMPCWHHKAFYPVQLTFAQFTWSRCVAIAHRRARGQSCTMTVPMLLQELISSFSLFLKKGSGAGKKERVTKIFCNYKYCSKC